MLNQLFSGLFVCLHSRHALRREGNMWLCICVDVERYLIPNHLEELRHGPSLLALPFTSLLYLSEGLGEGSTPRLAGVFGIL